MRRTQFAAILLLFAVALLSMDYFQIQKLHLPYHQLATKNGTSHSVESRKNRTNAICMPWPMYVAADKFPLSPNIVGISDKSYARCTGLAPLVRMTFDIGVMKSVSRGILIVQRNTTKFQNNTTRLQNNTTRVQKNTTRSNCVKVPPHTALSLLRMNEKNEHYRSIRECWHNQTDQPFIVFRQGSNTFTRIIPDLSTKDGFSAMVQRHDPDCKQRLDSCFFPLTFNIANDQGHCESFFSNPSNANQTWVKKPLGANGGRGITRVKNFHQELKQPFGQCNVESKRITARDIIVQRYLRSYALLDRAFHLRLFLLFKFGSDPDKANNGTEAGGEYDPPQAWFLKTGNVHICSEPLSKADDPVLGDFALKCNRHAWMKNPRIQKSGKRKAQDFFSVEAEETPSYPFPEFLRYHMENSEYNMVMGRIRETMKRLASVVDGFAREINDYSPPKEAMWFIAGVDFLIDENLRPWIMDFNKCPANPTKLDDNGDETRNPMISGWRVIMSHYMRHHVKDESFDESSCEGGDSLMDRVL